MQTPTPETPSRRAAERTRTNAIISDYLHHKLPLPDLADIHFKGNYAALTRWFKNPAHLRLIRALIAVENLRADHAIAKAREPAAATLLKLTESETQETARKAASDLLKGAQRRAPVPRKTAKTPTNRPPSDRDQQDMDGILDRFHARTHPTPDIRAHNHHLVPPIPPSAAESVR